MPELFRCVAVALGCLASFSVVSGQDADGPLAGKARNEAIARLGALYGELRALNEILLSDMKIVADAKDVPGVRAVFARKDQDYRPRAGELIKLAAQVPDTTLARDAALLILNTTSQRERDLAIDLLLEHHIDSPRMCEAVTWLGYTSRRIDIINRVLAENKDSHVLAHCRFVQADEWLNSPEDRPRAKEILYELLEEGKLIPYQRGGVWGPNQRKITLAEAASKLLKVISGKEAVEIGRPLPDYKSIDLAGKRYLSLTTMAR